MKMSALVASLLALSACGGGSTSTTTNTETSSSTSTADVLCSYASNVFNTSASVNATSTANWSCSGGKRFLTANGLPDHDVGVFPNANNPNAIAVQKVSVSSSLTPTATSTVTVLGGPRGDTGHVLNGVKIDASTAGSCDNSGASCSLIGNSGSWSIEALGQSAFTHKSVI